MIIADGGDGDDDDSSPVSYLTQALALPEEAQGFTPSCRGFLSSLQAVLTEETSSPPTSPLTWHLATDHLIPLLVLHLNHM